MSTDNNGRMKIKCATSLVVEPKNQKLLVHNFLSNERFFCSSECIAFLSELTEWTELETLFTRNQIFKSASLAKQIELLLAEGALIMEGTQAAQRDAEYQQNWEWGAASGFYHFSIRNGRFLSGPEQRDAIRARRAQKGPSPALIKPNNPTASRKLPAVSNNQLFDTIRQRRSIRSYRQQPISLQALTDCLFAGKGITGQISDPDFGVLPLGTTPSGGARNPYELCVYARQVAGLPQGWYHYSSAEHNLELLDDETPYHADLLAGQDWTESAGALIFLIADFSRTMWKYRTPPSYRVVLMEAGFIGQNITLAATAHQLSATPTASMQEDRLEAILGCTQIQQSVILALSIGHPDVKNAPPTEPVNLDQLTNSNHD